VLQKDSVGPQKVRAEGLIVTVTAKLTRTELNSRVTRRKAPQPGSRSKSQGVRGGGTLSWPLFGEYKFEIMLSGRFRRELRSYYL
jgi:hypothetical protein